MLWNQDAELSPYKKSSKANTKYLSASCKLNAYVIIVFNNANNIKPMSTLQAKNIALLILVVLTLQQDTGSVSSIVEVSPGTLSSLPQRTSAEPQEEAQVSTESTFKYNDEIAMKALEQSLNGQWQYPNGKYEMFPVGHIAKYLITFQVDCLKNSIFFEWTATGHSFVAINGLFVKIWAPPHPQTHKYIFNNSLLSCGCNKIEVHVLNSDAPSPAAFLYQLSTTLVACVCQNEGVTFYNRKTCECECASQHECPSKGMSWFGYPWCGCMCSRSLKCPPGKYFNRQKCSCDCEEKCCPKGHFQSGVTCQCVRLPVYSGTVNLSPTYRMGP